MSSHHIVRDNQEPALLVCGNDFNYTVLDNLLEWSPTVLLDEIALEKILSCNIKIDVVICLQENKTEIENKLLYQQPFKIITTKNENDKLESVFKYLAEKGNKNLNIIGKNEFTEQDWKLFLLLNVVVFSQNYRNYWKIENGNKIIFKESIANV